MAKTNPEPTSRAKTVSLTSFMAGVAAGLIVAALAAVYITQSPLPVTDRGLRKVEAPTKQGNKGADEESAAPVIAEPEPPPAAPIANESGVARPPMAEPPGTTYFLQLAAYRSVEEAEQMRARLAILGFEAAITQTRRDGTLFYRVRMGPMADFDELNRTKTALSDNGLESTVVRALPQ